MNLKHLIFLLALSIFTNSCGQNNSKQNDSSTKKFRSEEIGWSINVPDNYKMITQEQFKYLEDQGKKVIDEDIDTSQLKFILGFQKNKFNYVQATAEKLEHPENWEFYQKGLKNLMYNSYLEKGISVDSTKTEKVMIDGIDFYKFKFMIYNQKDELVLNQLLYSSLINGFSFGVNINYNNESNKKEMMDSWLNSKFSK